MSDKFAKLCTNTNTNFILQKTKYYHQKRFKKIKFIIPESEK